MSQAKVNRYKEEKANRKKTLAKQKACKITATVVAWVVLVGVVGLVGYKGYEYWDAKQPAKTIECTTTAVDDYLESVSY